MIKLIATKAIKEAKSEKKVSKKTLSKKKTHKHIGSEPEKKEPDSERMK